MTGPFLLAETPRGGTFGHRFLAPPAVPLRANEVEAYFQRAALGPGKDFIAVTRQVAQHLPTGAVREGSETLLLGGVNVKALGEVQVQEVRQSLNHLLPELERLVIQGIDWEKAGPQTLIVRQELADWLGRELAGLLARSAQTARRSARQERAARALGVILGLVVGSLILYLWFF